MYSKIIILVSYICAILLTVTVVVGTFGGYDMGSVTTIAALSWGEVAVSNAFYFKKAGRENAIKIASSLPKEMQAGIDVNSLMNAN